MNLFYLSLNHLLPFIDYPGSVQGSLIELFTLTRYSHKIYFILKAILVSGLFVLAIRKDRTSKQEIVFILLSLLTIFLIRLPNTILPEQNLDESFMIAGAGTMLNDPMVFKSFDGTTIGPIHYYFLAISYWLMGSINYTSIRILGLLFCILPGVFLLYKAIRLLYDQKTATIVLFGYTLCMAGATLFEFIAYSSEVLPHLLISVELFCLSAIMAGRRFLYACLLCFVAGLMPYAKLQGVPIAGTLVVFLFIELYNRLTIKRLVILGSLGVLPSIGLGLYLYAADLFPDFYNSYILFNLNYSSPSSGLRWALPLNMLFGNSEMPIAAFDSLLFILFVFFCIVLLGVSILSSRVVTASKRRVIYVFIILGIAWFSIIKPGQGFQHYLFFFFAPLFWGMGVVCGENQQIVRSNIYRFIFYVPFLLFFLIPALEKNKGIEYAYREQRQPDALVSLLKALEKPTDRISIWGHGNLAHIYCHTGLLPGTRDVFASRQINPSVLQPYFIRRYVDDLRHNRPRFILEDTRYESYQTRLNSIDSSFIASYQMYSMHDFVRLYIRR